MATKKKPVSHRVMVYGTLRDRAASQVATHRLDGFAMHDYGRFPYIVPLDSGTVYGNVIEVDDAGLAELDWYEGVARGLYTREKVRVLELSSGGYILAQVYVATNQLHPRRIESGDWYRRDEIPDSL